MHCILGSFILINFEYFQFEYFNGNEESLCKTIRLAVQILHCEGGLQCLPARKTLNCKFKKLVLLKVCDLLAVGAACQKHTPDTSFQMMLCGLLTGHRLAGTLLLKGSRKDSLLRSSFTETSSVNYLLADQQGSSSKLTHKYFS